MYRHSERQIMMVDEFFLHFGGKLNNENRWVKLMTMIARYNMVIKYHRRFRSLTRGKKAVSVRMALGSLIIQQRMGLSDRETVQ